MPRISPKPRFARFSWGDVAMLVLCITAVFWLLASPLIPYNFGYHPLALLFWTLGLGLPLGFVGVTLNHMAARSEQRKRR